MTKSLPFAAAALLALAACHNAPQQVDTTAPDPNAEAVNAALASGNIVLPPAMTGEVTFRCHDQSLVTVDFFQGDTQVMVKATPNDTGTRLTANAPGQPYVADGYSLSGSRTSVTVTRPGHPEQTCRA